MLTIRGSTWGFVAPGVLNRHRPKGGALERAGDQWATQGPYAEETPYHKRHLPKYWIGKYPMTNAEFARFADGDGYRNRAYWTRADR